MMNTLEESRLLTHAEFMLRKLVCDSARRQATMIDDYSRQRGKVRQCLLGDENTKYHHMCATIRMRFAPIKLLHDSQENPVFDHKGKEMVLLDFYRNLLGVETPCMPLGPIVALSADSSLDSHQAESLVDPFTSEEIRRAMFSMRVESAPEPDGFGPRLYQASWALLLPNIQAFMDSFHQEQMDLRGLNRAHMVLIPKTPTTSCTKDFRPISLQNCLPKLITKCLTNRLQAYLPALVHTDQTGFLKGRCIAENFVYATELVQCCYKRKAPTLILILDFRKAFDSISWDALDGILDAKGFSPKWRRWIRLINTSSQTVVMRNGVPGKWFQCRKGLRQGDPLSPYLFILAAAFLQLMIQSASRDNRLPPSVPGPHLPCAAVCR